MARAGRPTTRGEPRREREAPPAPTREALHEAALGYLAKSAATASSVRKTLERRITSWAKKAEKAGGDAEAIGADVARAKEAAALVLERLREVGLVDDAKFAAARARSLSRGGRSRRAITAHLTARGVSSTLVREAVPQDRGTELDAAIAFARKKRLGPFARPRDEDEDVSADERRAAKRKALGAMARAGFDFDVSERALAMDLDTAEDRLRDHRSR